MISFLTDTQHFGSHANDHIRSSLYSSGGNEVRRTKRKYAQSSYCCGNSTREHCYNLRPQILDSNTPINFVISGSYRRVNEILSLLLCYAT